MADDENNPGTPPPKEPKDQPKESAEDLDSRKNAAKAFYRALYSGENVVPDDFGMQTNKPAPERSGPCPNCARLEQELKENEQKAAENEKYYKRTAADFENYRKRTDREREEAVGLGVQKAVEAMLPALDDLDRAKASLAIVTDPKTVVEALNLVFQRFNKVLEPLGVKPMEVVGTPFDPKFHEPVQEVVTTEYADGAVAQELRRGYMLKDKVIRPSLVNVASNASGVITPKAAPEETAKETPKEEPANEEPAATSASDTESGAKETQTSSPEKSHKPDAEKVADSSASQESSREDDEPKPFDPNVTSENLPAFTDGLELNEGLNTSMGELSQSDVGRVDEAANQQRAQNALERLRSKEKKPSPKATVELPAYKPDSTESVTNADETSSGNGAGSSANEDSNQTDSEAKASDETDKSD